MLVINNRKKSYRLCYNTTYYTVINYTRVCTLNPIWNAGNESTIAFEWLGSRGSRERAGRKLCAMVTAASEEKAKCEHFSLNWCMSHFILPVTLYLYITLQMKLNYELKTFYRNIQIREKPVRVNFLILSSGNLIKCHNDESNGDSL